jgi:surface polysaccharide O-acyltransferase-like enzyme
MLSGALLLENSLTTQEFLKKRFSKILIPTLVWTLFYLFIRYQGEGISIDSVLISVLSIPFSSQGHGVLWFMYTLAGLYMLTPILSKWLKTASKREVKFYLLLWGITLIYPYLKLWLQVNESNTGILYYFSGFVGYFVFGYYLKHHYKYQLWHVIMSTIVAVIVPLLLYSSGIEFDFFSSLWYLSLPVAMLAFTIFVLVMCCPNKQMSLVSKISKLSFGIYFVHIFIMRRIIWNIDWINHLSGIVQITLIALSSFLLSLFLSWLISKLPFSKYMIGC